MTREEALRMVSDLKGAGVEFEGRGYYTAGGGTIPADVWLGGLNPDDWDVDFTPLFPFLAPSDPHADLVNGAAAQYALDPQFRAELDDAIEERLYGADGCGR